MNSEDLRNIARESNQKILEKRKETLVKKYQDFVQEGDIFVDNHVDKFIRYLDDRVKAIALSGEYNSIYTREVLPPKPTLNFANISDRLDKWEYFFTGKNNTKLKDWCNQNGIFLTVKEKYKYEYKAIGEREYWTWTVKIDIQKHSSLYKKCRLLFSGDKYYKFKMKNVKSKYKAIEKRARDSGFVMNK
ncbi:hypothetical protein [Leuconostoc citreum]